MSRLKRLVVAAAFAGLTSQNAGAVNIANEGIGEVAIAPYYTVRDGWQTLINLTNVTDSPLVVKIRVHEATNSRDVLDFLVGMSAFDVYSGVIRKNADGLAEFVSKDQPNDSGLVTCTVPSVVANTPQRLNPLGFAGGTDSQSNDDGGPGGDSSFANPNQGAIDRLSEGYVEFIVMGYGDRDWAEATDEVVFDGVDDPAGGLTGAINVARAIEQHDCANLDLAFDNEINPDSGNRYILDRARQMGEPINALKFNFRLLNPGRGTEAGNAATAWANFFNPGLLPVDAQVQPFDNAGCAITRGDYRSEGTYWSPISLPGNSSCLNLITAQVEGPFLEPSLNDAYPPIGFWIDDSTGLPAIAASLSTTTREASGNSGSPDGRPRGIDAISATIQRQAIINEWASSEGPLGVTTDWIVTMPTKSFYVDQGTGSQYAVTLDNPDALPLASFGRPESCIAELFGNDVDFNGDGDLDCQSVPYPPFSNAFSQSQPGNRNSAESCNEVGFVFYDRAEQTPVEGEPIVEVSPAPPVAAESSALCYETNVITFNGVSALDSTRSVNVSTRALGASSGWMFMALDQDPGAQLDVLSIPPLRGLPVIGFNLKQRNFGDISRNFTSSIDHGYLRTPTPVP